MALVWEHDHPTEELLVSIGWSKEGAKLIFAHKEDHAIIDMLNRIARKYGFKQFPLNQQNKIKRKRFIPRNIRWEIWERDNFTCLNCGERKRLTIDHIIPESKGGTLVKENLQTLCKSCNSKKGNRE